MKIIISPASILRAISAALGLFLIYQIALKIMGGSLTLDAINTILLSIIIVHLFFLTRQVSYLQGEFSWFKKSFNALASDFKEHVRRHGGVKGSSQ
ncbi:hypothetical protein HYU15_00945 [Candidatus Woesearchaeota archaeon]|nr:hypothetical protein [Candidatus Woesearchaeota archaeon]